MQGFYACEWRKDRARIWRSFEVEDRRGHAPVIFGEKEDKCLLGVTALEALGLEVDVVTGKLKPMKLLLL